MLLAMTCQDARELFPALVDGDIGLTERVPLESHLSECGDCLNALEVLRTSEHPRPPAWWPRPEFGFVNRAYEATRTLAIISPVARLDRFRKRMLARERLSRRPAPAVFADSPEPIREGERLAEPSGGVSASRRVKWLPRLHINLVASVFGNLRPAAIARRIRRPHAPVMRINWRPRFRLDRIRALLEAMVQAIDIRPRLRRASITLGHLVPRPRFDFAVIRKALDSIRRPKTLHRPRRPVSPHARPTTRRGLGLDAIRKALPLIRPAHVVVRMRACVWSPSRFVGPVRAGFGAVKTWIETTGSIARAAWLRLRVVQQLKVKHLRILVTLAAATIVAVGVLSYRAELDGAFRRWVPSAPSVAEAPLPARPPVVAYTERTPRPELPPVPPSPPATSVRAPSPPAPRPASRASEPSSPPTPAIERPKRSAPRQEPATARPVPAPSAQARESRSDRAVKSAEGGSAEAERQPQKGKNTGARGTTPTTAPTRSTPTAVSITASSSPPRAKATESTISSRATAASATNPAATAPTPPPPGTTRNSLDVVGKLVVKNRGGAERDLTALVAKAGGTTVSRKRGPHVTVIEAVVPNPSYGRFAAGLNRIGSWRIEAGRSSLPDPVRVTVRLAE